MIPTSIDTIWCCSVYQYYNATIPGEKFWLPVAKIILPLALGETTCVHILPIVNKQYDSYIL